MPMMTKEDFVEAVITAFLDSDEKIERDAIEALATNLAQAIHDQILAAEITAPVVTLSDGTQCTVDPQVLPVVDPNG